MKSFFVIPFFLMFSFLFGQDKSKLKPLHSAENTFFLSFSDVSDSYSLSYFPTFNFEVNYRVFLKKQKVQHFIYVGSQLNQTKDMYMNNLFLKTPLLIGVGGGNKVEFNFGMGVYYAFLLKYKTRENYLLPSAFEETNNSHLFGIRNLIEFLYRINNKNYIGIRLNNDFDITKLYNQVRFALGPNTDRFYEMKNYNLQIGISYNYRFLK